MKTSVVKAQKGLKPQTLDSDNQSHEGSGCQNQEGLEPEALDVDNQSPHKF